MRHRLASLRLLCLAAALAATGAARANTAVEPVPRDKNWLKRHEAFVQISQAGGVDVLFLGDSITDLWRNRGKAAWDQYYGGLHAANFGIGADRTQHVLWRLDHGEVDGLHPKVVVLMIGTNNTGLERNRPVARNTTAEAIAGVTAVVQELRTKLPDAKILLLSLLPRADTVAPKPADIREINAAIGRLDDGRFVRFFDLGAKFQAPDGTLIAEDYGADRLHPSPQGYAVWAQAMQEPLAQLLR
jgi:lysophospholipase L1-like esterase